MDGTVRYLIVKKHKGSLNKKTASNTHLFFIPIDPKQFMYIAVIGQIEEEENTYVAQLLVKIPEDIIDDTINGEFEYFGDRLVEIESLECKSSNPSPGKYVINFPKKGMNILSDIELNYQVEYSTIQRRIYILKGNLNLVTGDVEMKDMSSIAAKVMKDLGGRKRFQEMQTISDDRKLLEVSCKETLMNIVKESEKLKGLPFLDKTLLYDYIKEMEYKDVASLLYEAREFETPRTKGAKYGAAFGAGAGAGAKFGIKGAAVGAVLGSALMLLYRRLSDPCIKNNPGNRVAQLECRLEGMRRVLAQIQLDLKQCDHTRNPEKCREKLNEEYHKWQDKYEEYLVKLTTLRRKKAS